MGISYVSDTDISSGIFDEEWPLSFVIVIDTNIVSSRSHICTKEIVSSIGHYTHTNVVSSSESEVTSNKS